MKSAGNIYDLHKKHKAWSKETAGVREIPLPLSYSKMRPLGNCGLLFQ